MDQSEAYDRLEANDRWNDDIGPDGTRLDDPQTDAEREAEQLEVEAILIAEGQRVARERAERAGHNDCEIRN